MTRLLARVFDPTAAAGLAADRRGTAAIEFAIVAPVLLMFGLGILKFGIAISHYLTLLNGAAQGAMVLGASRGNASPYTRAAAAISGSTPGLNAKSITTTVSVGNATCKDDPGCKPLLVNGAAASVTLTYPCDLSVMGIDFKSGCTLTATSVQVVY